MDYSEKYPENAELAANHAQRVVILDFLEWCHSGIDTKKLDAERRAMLEEL